MVKACIFDFDGVLVDSEKYHHRSFEMVADFVGVEFTYEEYAPFKSTGRKQIISYLFEKAGKTMTQEDFDKCSRLRDETYATVFSELSSKDVIAGATEFVRLCKSHGLKCAVVSSSKSSEKIAKDFGIFELFDAFIDGQSNLPLKPNPDMLLLAAEKLGVKPSDCVVFEDSINGILAAKNAKMHCIGYQTHFTDKADKIIDTFVGADLSLLDFCGQACSQ
ncbi:MAG: HAD family phosphatase [Clostridiales bacterium]|nr:HAD family phosphatase [Clostridiales bacterium]